jgi:hypothetical protein
VTVNLACLVSVSRVTVDIRRIALFVTLLTLSACGGKLAPTLTYQVSIDPSFTTPQVDAITVGLDDWRTSVPELKLTYAIGRCDSPSSEVVCIHPANDPPSAGNEVVGTTRPGPLANATVWIYVDRIRASGMNVNLLTEQTTAHEMGHAMGLVHSPSGELMAADVSDQAHIVTPADVAQFWSIRDR